jgi:hypothetical protein
MPSLHFLGHVLPPIFKLQIKGLPEIQYQEQSMTIKFKIAVTDSEVDVQVDIDPYDHGSQFSMIYTRAFDLTRAAVDCWSFANGKGLTVFIDRFIDANGNESTIAPEAVNVGTFFTAFNLHPNYTGPDNYEAMVKLFVVEPGAFMALNDLILAITMPHHAPVNCARAVEGLRTLMVPKGTDRKQAWPLMRNNLNVEADYVLFVTDLSKAPRHGDRTFIDGTKVNETVARSWIIMNRFLEFRKRGNLPLPLADFPLLR